MRPSSLALQFRPADAPSEFEADVLAGLSATPKRLLSKYFYDAQGSDLFERICAQPEYYLTRVELDIMRCHAGAMAEALGPDLRLVEFGSGAGHKTRLLLAALKRPAAYVPVEISESALRAACAALSSEFPTMTLQPCCADFCRPFTLPPPPPSVARTAVYFPGSTLGNFDHGESLRLLQHMRRLVGEQGAILLGLDLKKPRAELEAAYNDAAGVTAAFTLNLLTRINRELRADFDLSRFRHRARYDAVAGRIVTDIVARESQSVTVAGRRFRFAADEAMHVEISCKYDDAEVGKLATRAGLAISARWSDASERFAVYLLRVRPD